MAESFSGAQTTLDSEIIDAHALLGVENHLALTADDLQRRMDASRIATAVARPMGAGLVVDNGVGNDRVLSHAPRIRGLVSVNPWYGDRAREELERCRDRGAVGLFLHPSRQGFMPTDDVASPVIEQAAAFGWPLMFHTGTYVQSDILAVVDIARRYPATAIICGFGGFTDMWFELPVAFQAVPNLYLDASMIWSESVRLILTECGADRILFGSAEPRNRYETVLRMINRVELDNEQRQAILSANAKRVFRL